MKRKFIAAVIATLIAGQALALDVGRNSQHCLQVDAPQRDRTDFSITAAEDAAMTAVPLSHAGKIRLGQILNWCMLSPQCHEDMRQAIDDGDGVWGEVKDDLAAMFEQPRVHEQDIQWMIGAGRLDLAPETAVSQVIELQHDYVDSFRQIPAITPAGWWHHRVAGNFIRSAAPALTEGVTATIIARDDAEASQVADLYRSYGAKANFERAIDPAAKLVTIKIHQAAN